MDKPDLKLLQNEDIDAHTNQPQQVEMPFAIVEGESLTELPRDLYIPPVALKVFLDTFEGPLDLLLYLIRKQNLNILDVPIADITDQYVNYINLMKELELELAGEYLLMAAMLAEIKSKMLLPLFEEVEDEEDPRAELVRRLLEYERYRKASEELNKLKRLERDVFITGVESSHLAQPIELPDIALQELLLSFQEVLKRAEMFTTLHVLKEPLSVRERMTTILEKLKNKDFLDFTELFDLEEQKTGLVVTFLAILELMKESLIEIVQTKAYGIIHVKALLSDNETNTEH
ncbi:MAG TPA: segregation/condensation protein A [Gammaproteobacteria bacterium]|jgi:segregation and condensation protein A|nr:segregation/condensation protein A [Gammaproteobacteria bacterium]HIB25768.1 segregation/condensation protein A [Gammaproteobacteria bacterium]HIG35264.1 segregation/condensation protein A [Gammaproteobacteria bacterium]